MQSVIFNMADRDPSKPGPSWRSASERVGIHIEKSAMHLLDKLMSGELSGLSDLSDDGDGEEDTAGIHNSIAPIPVDELQAEDDESDTSSIDHMLAGMDGEQLHTGEEDQLSRTRESIGTTNSTVTQSEFKTQFFVTAKKYIRWHHSTIDLLPDDWEQFDIDCNVVMEPAEYFRRYITETISEE
ncbi:uncharacterized protein [Anabrus simplex]|uniref:uncharacterized protein n=1 Tax=Anabrus simplex TaxID=316456 RepID=UPI0035A39948